MGSCALAAHQCLLLPCPPKKAATEVEKSTQSYRGCTVCMGGSGRCCVGSRMKATTSGSTEGTGQKDMFAN